MENSASVTVQTSGEHIMSRMKSNIFQHFMKREHCKTIFCVVVVVVVVKIQSTNGQINFCKKYFKHFPWPTVAGKTGFSLLFFNLLFCPDNVVDLQWTRNNRRHWLILVSHTAVLLGSSGSKVMISIWIRPAAEKTKTGKEQFHKMMNFNTKVPTKLRNCYCYLVTV